MHMKSGLDDVDSDIVNFPFLDGDVHLRSSYGVFISQLIRFARVCNHARNKCLTAKLLQQGYRYHKLRKTFSKFYRRHHELISKFNVGLKGTSRQRSGKGAIRKGFPLQKPRWEKTKLTIETHAKSLQKWAGFSLYFML